MSKKAGSILNLVVAISMILTLFAVQPGRNTARAQQPRPQQPPPELAAQLRNYLQKTEELSGDAAINKIDPSLHDKALARGKELIDVFVSISGSADLGKYLTNTIVRPVSVIGVHTVYGRILASDLIKLAQQPGVVSITDASLKTLEKPNGHDTAPDKAAGLARLNDLKAKEVTYRDAQKTGGQLSPQDWFDVADGHKSSEAWKKGFKGNGVLLGVIDDGIDFGHPDLMGTTARVTDPSSPYFGWPMAFSQASTQYFAYDVFAGTDYIASQSAADRWALVEDEADVAGTGTGTASFQPIGAAGAHDYTIPLTSQSGHYKFTSLPENNLYGVYGEKAAVLVVDEGTAGVYDTVYVDLDDDYDFTDEKPDTQADPEIWRDMDADGYTDISGGMLAWISDGANPPPVTDWMWGVTCSDFSPTMEGCPASGDLLIFTGALTGGYSHGTQCASNEGAQGVVSGGLTAQPFRTSGSGMVRGAAPDVSLVDLGDFYYSFTAEDHYLVAALGFDGVPNSGDEIQITSNSYGAFGQMWGSFGNIGRLLTAINLFVAPETTFIFSAGNEGPGYGPQEGDGGATTIQVGSSTQYGSTNWDSISTKDQLVYGDVTTFFSKGPNRDGTSGLDVLANGGRGAGDEAINYAGFNGWYSWDTWGGTSRSGPVAAGNLALIYNAYNARFGTFPNWATAKALLKSGADNASSAPFFQGGGVVNADRSTDVAAGIYGVYAMPTEWNVGDWKGEQFLNFPNVAEPGNSYQQTYTVKNPSGYDITVNLSDGYMTRVGQDEINFTTSDQSLESGFNFHSPDYLIKMDDSKIPAGTDLMVVRYVHPYDTFDPDHNFTGSPNSSWRFMFYNWTDINHDGKLWTDTNANGVVNHVDDTALGYDNDGFLRPDYSSPDTEIEQGEYVRMDYEFGGLAVPIYVRDPLARMGDGYFFGLQHRNNDHTVNTTSFKIGVEYYKRADWPWLSLSSSSLNVPAGGEATFNATAAIPADAKPGAYEGVIYMADPGHLWHAAHETALPVTVNVIADLPDNGAVEFGGGSRENTLYQNSVSHGYFNLYGGGWQGAGDWRHYFFDVSQGDLPNQNLLVHTSWADAYPTDYNTFVLGPTEDCASNNTDCGWPWGLFDTPYPDIFGPYTLWPIAQSEPMRAGSAYPFHTSTGGPDDWLLAPMTSEGLHEVALDEVLYSGQNLWSNFDVKVGTLRADAVVADDKGTVTTDPFVAKVYDDEGAIDLSFTSSLALPDLNATLEGGLQTDSFGPFTTLVPDNGKCYDPDCANNVFAPFDVTQDGATQLDLVLEVPAGQDADLFLMFDTNGNNTYDPGVDQPVGSSGNSAGVNEEIVVNNPALGRYWADFSGYAISPTSGVNMDWHYTVSYPGGLPSEAVDVFTGTPAIGQDTPADPLTASFSQELTTDERTAAIHATVTGIPAGANVDLYLTDEANQIVASSLTAGNADEELVLKPAAGYRLEAGKEYTVLVHGVSVPTPPVNPTVHVWTDELNVWLSATDPDVHVMGFDPGDTATMTIHFSKDGWAPGDPSLSARVVAGPTVLPGAFDRLLVIERAAQATEWNPDNLAVSYTVESARGPSPSSPYTIGGVPVPTALGGAGEDVTWTMTVTNDDPNFATPALWLWAEIDNASQGGTYLVQTFHNFVVEPDPVVGAWDYDDTYKGVEWMGSLAVGQTFTLSWSATTAANMTLGKNHLSLVYDLNSKWTGLAGADVYNRTFRTTGSQKLSNNGAGPGDELDYTVHLINPSAEDRWVFMYDPLPADVEFVSTSNQNVAYYSPTRTVTWSGLLPGNSLTGIDMTFTVRVNNDVPEGTTIDNEAFLSNTFNGLPFTTLSARTSVDDGVNPDLVVTKTVNQLVSMGGKTVEYTIVVENQGRVAASGVVLTDPIPDGLTVDVASITGGASLVGNVLTWTGDLAPGASHTITFQATLNAGMENKFALINGARAEAPNFRGSGFGSALTEIMNTTSVFLPLIAK